MFYVCVRVIRQNFYLLNKHCIIIHIFILEDKNFAELHTNTHNKNYLYIIYILFIYFYVFNENIIFFLIF
jgi:hypothetical protein